MRERWRAWWLRLPWWRALGETLAIQVAITLVVWLVVVTSAHPYAARNVVDAMVFIGPFCILWCAFRMEPARVAWWRWFPLDMLCGVALSVLPAIAFAIIARFVFKPVELQRASPGQYYWYENVFFGVVIGGCIFGFVASRIGVRILIFWNRLRRTRLLWSLTHAHLLVVVAGAAFTGGAVTIVDALLSHTLPITILPILFVLLIFTVIVLLFVLPPSALFSFLFARRITRRLRSLTEATDRLRAGDYTTRVAVTGEDELAQLQVNFNAMAVDLDRSVRELQEERDNVSQLLAARRELIASVSHELRTPIATLRGYLESSREHWDSIDPDVLRRDLAVMESQTIHLQSLINDLFTLARAEVGKLDMRCEPLDVRAVASRVANALAPLAWQRSRIEVVAELCPPAPLAMVDGNRLEQVLQNLLHNAIRHTPPGGIVAVRVEQGDQSLVVEVKDTGEGIAEADLAHIFERFYRSDAARAHPDSGSGLGLTLVKELTEAMGGSVSVTSVVGQGSSFAIRLPLATEHAIDNASRRTNPHLAQNVARLPGVEEQPEAAPSLDLAAG